MTWTFHLPTPELQYAWKLSAGEEEADILLIEDDRAIAEMYTLQLQLDGYRVRLAVDGPAGLAQIRRRMPALLLLDLRLPHQDGFEVLSEIRAQPELSQMPVVILSNYGDAAIISRGLAMGARDYLVKSRTTPAELSARIRHWLAPTH